MDQVEHSHEACFSCEAGTYSENRATSCSPCEEGYFCPAETSGSSLYKFSCPSGTYAGPGASACEECPAGSYCPEQSMSAPRPCPPGRYSSSEGATYCEACTGGYICPESGSTTATFQECPPGEYSVSASPACSKCSAGRYGTGKSSTSACSGECPPGTYSAAGQESCTLCAPGSYGRNKGQSSCTGICEPGRYGSGLTPATSSLCDGPCTEGYYCNWGSTSPTQWECGANDVFCPAGSTSPTTVAPGHYSTGGSATTRTGQDVCPAGQGKFCSGGVIQSCAAGRFGLSYGLPTDQCDGPCPRGYYCPTGSAYASRCGSAKVYCPLGSEAPITVPTGKYSAPLGVDEAVRY